MNKSEIIACAFESWYSKFKDITINSVIIDLPDEVLEYIKTAPLVVPKNAVPVVAERDEFSDDSDEESWSDEGEGEELKSTSFPEFEEKVDKIIGDFSGEVFPKLNWSSPKDAAWINFGSSLKCTKASDVLVLLKASDFVGYDIYKPSSKCVMLIDFNVYGPPTDGLLFDFDEVDKLPLDDSNLEFRWQTDKTLRSDVFSQYKLPVDLVDISVGNDPEKLMDLIQAEVQYRLSAAGVLISRHRCDDNSHVITMTCHDNTSYAAIQRSVRRLNSRVLPQQNMKSS
ncbi:hypothetical protein ACTXT7_006561 [Hymenolepis weldensis]